MTCPCGSGKPYADCCEPYISGAVRPDTAEQLMRSRYSAYAKVNMDYLHDTLHPDHRQDHDRNAARRWAEESDWLGLTIVATEDGQAGDKQGVVEFRASYREKGKNHVLHEVSRFENIDGQWYYVDGEHPRPTTVRNEQKVGRNDPCPCGSGKKYKKCCGA
jgi:SEC-C motif-containing protein